MGIAQAQIKLTNEALAYSSPLDGAQTQAAA
jgi:hypothetical protein